MGTSFVCRDFWDRLVGQAFIMIGQWYSSQLLTNHKNRLSTQRVPEIVAPKASNDSRYSLWSGKLMGLWHASAHLRHLDLWSWFLVFFKICFWWKNPLPSTLRCPRKLLYQYSRAIWSILEVLSAIFCIFVEALFRKFEVIEEKCTKAYWLSVFLQTDQMWRLMWSSGFHFCLFSSPLNDLPFSVRF